MSDTMSDGLIDQRIQSAIKFSSEARQSDESINMNRTVLEQVSTGKNVVERLKNEAKGLVEKVSQRFGTKTPEPQVFQGVKKKLYTYIKSQASNPEQADEVENWLGQLDPPVAIRVKTASGQFTETLVRKSSKIDTLASESAYKMSPAGESSFLFNTDGSGFTFTLTDDTDQNKNNIVYSTIATDKLLKIIQGEGRSTVSFDKNGATIPIIDKQRGLLLVTVSYDEYLDLEQKAKSAIPKPVDTNISKDAAVALDEPIKLPEEINGFPIYEIEDYIDKWSLAAVCKKGLKEGNLERVQDLFNVNERYTKDKIVRISADKLSAVVGGVKLIRNNSSIPWEQELFNDTMSKNAMSRTLIAVSDNMSFQESLPRIGAAWVEVYRAMEEPSRELPDPLLPKGIVDAAQQYFQLYGNHISKSSPQS
ncbi:hypothetical protein BH09PAT2_BH09PAT2_02360 [soil metagenome]